MKRASYMYLKVTIKYCKKNDAGISFSKLLCRNSFTDEIFLTFLQAHLVFIIIGGTSVLYTSISPVLSLPLHNLNERNNLRLTSTLQFGWIQKTSFMANKSNKEPSSSFLFVNEGICMRPLRAL